MILKLLGITNQDLRYFLPQKIKESFRNIRYKSKFDRKITSWCDILGLIVDNISNKNISSNCIYIQFILFLNMDDAVVELIYESTSD